MARIARVVLPDFPHHITQRGVRSLPVFRRDEDRLRYLRLQKEQGERFGVSFISYCLMDNHVHLIAIPRDENGLARAIGEAHRLYTRSVNQREEVKGYLFQGRFYSCPLDTSHLFTAVRYVERNPVRAGIVEKAWDYRWSSAGYHAGEVSADILVSDSHLLAEIGDWKSYLSQYDHEIDPLRRTTRTGRPLGTGVFVSTAEKITKRKLHPRKGGRPVKTSIVSPDKKKDEK